MAKRGDRRGNAGALRKSGGPTGKGRARLLAYLRMTFSEGVRASMKP